MFFNLQTLKEHHRLYFENGAWIRFEENEGSRGSSPLCFPFSSNSDCQAEDISAESDVESDVASVSEESVMSGDENFQSSQSKDVYPDCQRRVPPSHS